MCIYRSAWTRLTSQNNAGLLTKFMEVVLLKFKLFYYSKLEEYASGLSYQNLSQRSLKAMQQDVEERFNFFASWLDEKLSRGTFNIKRDHSQFKKGPFVNPCYEQPYLLIIN